MSEPLSDLQLVKQVRLGDPAALEQLYDRYGRAIFNLAYRMLQDVHVAEEVVQDVVSRKFGRRLTCTAQNKGNLAHGFYK